MRQPNRVQWMVISVAAALLVMAWPPDGGGTSLAVTVTRWLVDPRGTLPALAPPLPPGVGDNGDIVAQHDEQESEYYRLYNSSSLTRWRMQMKAARDPFDPTTTRQWLVAIAVAAALLSWRLRS